MPARYPLAVLVNPGSSMVAAGWCWQSEFLAVGSMVVLSIFLRERESPEPKPVGAPHPATDHQD
jgi:hypothetical protein